MLCGNCGKQSLRRKVFRPAVHRLQIPSTGIGDTTRNGIYVESRSATSAYSNDVQKPASLTIRVLPRKTFVHYIISDTQAASSVSEGDLEHPLSFSTLAEYKVSLSKRNKWTPG